MDKVNGQSQRRCVYCFANCKLIEWRLTDKTDANYTIICLLTTETIQQGEGIC
jgi:hypothetical protein